jgi:hypothetical protein
MFNFIIFILICISIGFFICLFYILYILLSNKTFLKGLEDIEKLSKTWIILKILLKPFPYIVNLFISEPSIPASKKIQLNDYCIYLANVPHKITKKRLNLEIMCFIDLYYHHKRRKQTITKQEKYYTAISEEAYIKAQWLLRRTPQVIEDKFCNYIDTIYINNIRWNFNCLQTYNPNDNIIYFSSN